MKKTKRETLFVVIGIILSVILAGTIVYSINFLLQNTSQALNQQSGGAKPIVRFNFDGLKKIGIIK